MRERVPRLPAHQVMTRDLGAALGDPSPFVTENCDGSTKRNGVSPMESNKEAWQLVKDVLDYEAACCTYSSECLTK
jgi:hypothetical protein